MTPQETHTTQSWKQFGKFFLRLDLKPINWEQRITLFLGYLIEYRLKNSTIKSYLSALRAVLAEDGIEIKDDKFALTSLIRASRIRNDVLQVRLPLHKGMLGLILQEVTKYFDENNQPYLKNMYTVTQLGD